MIDKFFKKSRVLLVFVLCTVSLSTSTLSAESFLDMFEDDKDKGSLGIFHNLWGNTKDSFSGNNMYYHVGAFSSTYVIAESHIDDTMYEWSLKNHFGSGYGDASFIAGMVLQPLIGGVLYFSDDPETKTAGSAVIQTMMIQSAYVGLLKGVTGRPDPVLDGDITNADPSDTTCGNSFNPRTYFDIGKGCSWPSGHTSSVVSLVSTLYAFYPEKSWIAYVGYPLAMGIGMGMVDADEHWFSEIVAGALIGHVIGWSVGQNFRNDFDGLERKTQNHFFTPKVTAMGGMGINYVYQF